MINTKQVLIVLLSCVALSAHAAWSPPYVNHTDVTVEVQQDPSSGEYLYHYSLDSKPENGGLIQQFIIDLKTKVIVPKTASAGTVAAEADDYYNPADKMVQAVVTSSPTKWGYSIGMAGVVVWNPDMTDFILPGQTRSGYTLRSPSPPGPRNYTLIPRISYSPEAPWAPYGEECEITPECPKIESFYATGTTIGPVLTAERDFINSSGELSSNPNEFFRFAMPLELKYKVPAGTRYINMVVRFGNPIIPATFEARVNRIDITPLFSVAAGAENVAVIPLNPGRNAIQFSIQGSNLSGKGKDIVTEKAKFVVTVDK
jgi:hypothetical protein